MPLALLGGLLSTPFGPGTVASGARLVARNIPLVVLLALIALLFWPSEPATETAAEEVEADAEEAGAGRPNGAGPRRAPNGYHPEAAA
jgi:hypothetical protein